MKQKRLNAQAEGLARGVIDYIEVATNCSHLFFLYACFADDFVLSCVLCVVAADGQGGVVAYPYQYGGCHDAVVVVAFDGAHLFAVVFEFVNIEFEDGVDAALYVEAVAQGFDEEVDDHGLGGGVGVESPFPGATFADVYLGGAAVEVGVFAGDFVEDVFEVVAFGAFGFEGVCFDYQ